MTTITENFVSEYPAVGVMPYDQLRATIQSGDILLCSGNSEFSHWIREATHSVWSHVGFIIRLEAIDRIMVLESVETIGVRTVPLSQYALNYQNTQRGYPGRVLIARHTQFQPDKITQLSKHAVDLLGSPYHTQEILQIAARIGRSAMHLKPPSLTNQSFNKKAYICSEYAAECYHSVGIEIAYNPAGFIAPADFARDPHVKPLAFVET